MTEMPKESMDEKRIVSELQAIVGEKNATAAKHVRYAYSYDMSFVMPKLPDFVVMAETVEQMLSDLSEGRLLKPPSPTAEAAAKMVEQRQPEFFSFDDWRHMDRLEIERGQAIGRPRLKITRIDEMLTARET